MRHFQYWYYQWGEGMQNLLQGECAGMFKSYLEGTMSWCSDEGCYVGSVVDCLLGNTNESWKANMASGSMILGLLPTILAVGGRPSTLEIGVLSLRRPFLAFLLGVGSPGITSIPALEYNSPIQTLLKKQPDSLSTPKLSTVSAIAIVTIEYIFACGAIANVAHTSWQLGVSTVCSMAFDNTWLPLLWTFSTPLIYACGTVAVMVRTEFTICDQGAVQKAGMFEKLFGHEMQLCSQQAQASLSFRRESFVFISLSLVTSFLATVHLAFGTVLLSSTLFVGTGDAFTIAARYFTSAAVCRVILMFEMSGIRQTVDLRYEYTRNSLSHQPNQ